MPGSTQRNYTLPGEVMLRLSYFKRSQPPQTCFLAMVIERIKWWGHYPKLMLITLFYLVSWHLVFAQGNQDGLAGFVQLDRHIYAAGETVRGGIYIGNPEAVASVLRIEITNSDETALASFFIKISENSRAHFYHDIPYNLSSGSYRLTVYTRGVSRDIALCGVAYTVVNPADEKLAVQYKSYSSPQPGIVRGAKRIKVDFNADNVTISDLFWAGKTLVSISIVDGAFQTGVNIGIMDALVFKQVPPTSWKRNIWLSGQTLKNKMPVSIPILGLYANEEDKFYLSKSDHTGNFYLDCGSFSGYKNFQVMAHGFLHDELTLTKEKPLSTLARALDLPMPAEADDYHQLTRLKQSINQYFGLIGAKTNEHFIHRQEQSLKPQKSYIPANYKKFDLFHDFCRENDTPLKFKEKENIFISQLLIPGNYAKKFNALTLNTLFRVNGQITRNYDRLAKLKTEEVDHFHLHYDLDILRKTYNIFGIDGLVVIKTKSNVDVLSEAEKQCSVVLHGFQTERNSLQLEIEAKTKDQKTPVFEPTLYFSLENIENRIDVVLSSDRGL
ncbi:MAG: hypothetical protein IPN29_12850 [Saprospiraceae bacterium]|nr:hypothetical protein [Saprospiraceae bacterium]